MKAGRDRWRAIGGMVGVAMWLGAAALAAAAPADEPPRPRIALVLGGGGARGAAHIGVLEVLEEENIPIDYVVGTSMGAIIGALLAQGMSAAEIEAQVRAADWQQIFTDEPPREDLAFRRKQDDLQDLVPLDLGLDGWRPVLPRGLLAGQNLSLLLRRLTLPSAGIDDFDRLPIPFRAVAADIETGEAVVLAKGDLTTAVRASMAVPGIFAPIPWGDRWLVDGGIARNLPVDVARDLGADVVIAVEVGTPTADRDELKSLLDVFLQVTYIMINRNSAEQIATLGTEDMFLRPDLEGVSAADFDEYERAILAGRAAAREQLPSLRRYAVPANHSRERPREGGPGRDPAVHVDSLEIDNRSPVTTPEIRGRLTLEPGTDVPVSRLQRDVTRIYGMGAFEQVDYAVVSNGDRHRLVITTTGRSLGPTHLRAGLTLRSTFDGDSGVTLRLDVTRMQLNRRGAEWKNRIRIGDTERLFSELYQPLDYGGLFFLAPRIEGERHTRNVFVESERVAQYSVSTYGVGLDAGMQLGPHWGEIRIGLIEDWANADRRIGPPELLEYELRRVAYAGSLVLDRLDRASFPLHGGYAYARVRLAREALGSDVTYDRLSTGLTMVGTRGGNTLTGTFLLESSLDSTLPTFDRFGLGGLHRLSGYQRDQLTGGHVALGELVYRRKIGSLPRGVGGATCVGASVEAGNAWQDRPDVGLPDLILAGSLFLGVDTVLGPLHLAYGQAERGHRSAYLVLGQTL